MKGSFSALSDTELQISYKHSSKRYQDIAMSLGKRSSNFIASRWYKHKCNGNGYK